FPAIILRPGFVYGPRDRTVLPRLLEKLKSNQFAYLGSSEKLMNNTYVENLCEAVFAALESDELCGQIYNIRDDRLVTKQEFVETIA
ncbi:MAG: NAD-dependent epimerase/dehydratase family protein, partial [Planctomycetaceae bacterium]